MASFGHGSTDALMPDIFLSYSREDQPTARRFADALAREGFSVWWDQALHPGEAFDQVTEKALEEAGAVIVLWSRASVQSRWVRAEATQANADNRLVPVMIEPCKRPIMFELLHTAELQEWQGNTDDPRWRAFVASLSRLTGLRALPAAASTAPAPAAIQTPIRGSRINSRNAAVVVGVLLLLSAAVWAGFAAFRSQPAVSPAPTAATPTEPIRILVLPFANLSSDEQQGYFADNLASEISNLLGQVKGLRPLGDATSRALKGKTAAEIVEAVGVSYLVDGNFRVEGSNRVIIAQLLDRDGAQLWSHRYEKALGDTSSLYEEIAKDIAEHVGIVLDVGDLPRAYGGSNNPAAYDMYLRAISIPPLGLGSSPDLHRIARERLQLMRDAVRLDPQFARAWITLLTSFSTTAAQFPGAEARALLRERAETIVRLQGMQFEGWLDQAIHAEAYMYQGRWTQAVGAARAAAAAAPSEELGARTLWPILMRVGWFEEAIPYMQTVLRADPLDNRAASRLADALRLVGRDAEAQAAVARFGTGRVPMAFNWTSEEFWRLIEYGSSTSPADLAAMKRLLAGANGQRVEEMVGVASRMVGDPAAIRAALRRTLDDPEKSNEYNLTLLAPLATFFGNDDLGFEALRRIALESRVSSLGPWSFPRLREGARFRQLLQELQLVDFWRQGNRWSDFCRPTGSDFECFDRPVAQAKQ